MCRRVSYVQLLRYWGKHGISARGYISKSVNQPRVPEVNAGLRGKGAEMLQAIRPGVSAGLTRALPGFLSLPLIRGFLHCSPINGAPRVPRVPGNHGEYMFIALTQGFYFTPLIY